MPTQLSTPATPTTNPMLDLALAYAAAGIPVFPCRAAPEDTNEVTEDGEVVILKPKTPFTSNGFKGATKSDRIINILWGERHPGAVVGAPTGEQMGAWVLDVDVHKDDAGKVIDNGYETIAALEAKHGELPRTAVAQTAGGGEHHYFRYAPGVRNRGKLGAGLDVRGQGGFVVMPGSVMADGSAYHWLDHDGDGLPELPNAPEWLLALVCPPPPVQATQGGATGGATGGDYHYEPGSTGGGQNSAYVERAVEAELRELACTSQGGRGEAVNRSAFNLGTLVGAGALSRSEAEAGLFDAAFSNGVVAKDGEKEIRRKIKRGLDAGIRQPRQIPEPSYDDMAGWGHVDHKAFIKNSLRKRATGEQVAGEQAVVVVDDSTHAPATIDDDDSPPYTLDAVADLESLTYPGGVVQDMVDWIVSSAEQPCRALALAASLPMVATLIGARYSTGSRDTRANIYTVALAESGFGKEHARSQIKRLMSNSHGVFDDFVGPARIMSASALREVLEKNPAVNCQIDEFGGFVRDITDRKAGGHQRAISTDFRDYYSASSTFFEGAAYRGTPPKRIYNPCLCVHGTSTPDQFWTALSSASAEDGLLPRLILFHIRGDKPPAVKPAQDVRYVPGWLMERMAAVAGMDVAKQRMGGKKLPHVEAWAENKPTVVPWTPDAMALFGRVKAAVEVAENATAAEGRPFVRRIIENAIKLALIVAVGTDPAQPVITEANFEWAAGVAWTCAADMLAEVTERLADNQREANYKKIAGLIRKAGANGVTEGRLFDRCKAIETWQREDILKDLIRAGSVVLADNDNKKGRPRRRLMWVA